MSKEAIEQKEVIVGKLKDSGCRITKQRLILLDVILEGECGSCKEIYYRASKIDHSIGTATVYRMINTLEEIGAIDRKNMYRVQVSAGIRFLLCGQDKAHRADITKLERGDSFYKTAPLWKNSQYEHA